MSGNDFIEVAFFDLGDTLIDGKSRTWLPGAENTLAELNRKNVRLGVISNTGDLPRPKIMERLPQNFSQAPFETGLIIFSSEVQLAKPDRRIFRLAVEKTGTAAGKCLFCTEETAHFANAQKEGLKTIAVKKPPNSNIGKLVEKLIAAGRLPV